ncbi:CAMKK protein kinase [Saprolegnia diclina VS20]|uniref:CAMKK protein kinase n=1 Tax=Saprolegnia diclina (strain VS20) TaxID=1156394 RepID=T0RTF0_SAPDV|nr:CAMKK protein kinase [Saprolegnia diclina VS20]EQC33557.1 CAMKK protein kinase [Saprolegnia diclina VS20]|eukprot:XP_008613197.1 CAMKK protein kinase [Saprolegnia diclina VS20]
MWRFTSTPPVDIVAEGFLLYSSPRRPTPTARWCVLDGARHTLSKYESAKRSRLLGGPIEIIDARIVEASESATSFTLHLKTLYHGMTELTFTADSSKERARWVDALTRSSHGLASGISKRMAHRGVLNGQYVLVRELGRGASGIVYLYTWHGKPCAVKRLSASHKRGQPPGTLPDDARREIAILRKVSNLPHVVSLYDVIHDSANDCVYLVMEFLGGGPIASYDKATKRFHTKHIMGEGDLKRLLRCASVGLKYLHANHLVHRDIKPDNLLLTDDGRECKLADLGVAHFFPPPTSLQGDVSAEGDDDDKAAAGSAPGMLINTKGTYEFMSPEALSGEEYSGYAADIWALGVTLYALAVGQLPFQAQSILALFDVIATAPLIFPTTTKALSPALTDLITRMLTKDVAQRITLDDVLLHPWLSTGATKQYLHHSTAALGEVVIDASDMSGAVSPLQLKFDQLRMSVTASEDLALWSVLSTSTVACSTNQYTPTPIDIVNVPLPVRLRQDIVWLAQQVHFAWCTTKTLEGWRAGPERSEDEKIHPLLVPYQHLDDAAKTRNLASVTASVQCIVALGYALRAHKASAPTRLFPLSLERISLSGDLVILGDLLAENDHEVWAHEYMALGWKYGAGYDPELKTHPSLVPFPALPAGQRDATRNAALVVIKSLVALQYSIQHIHAKYNHESNQHAELVR